MRTKIIAALVASGCLIGYQAAAVAQDLAEHPTVSTPNEAKQKPNAAAQYRDQGTSSSNEQETGRPAPGPHESGH